MLSSQGAVSSEKSPNQKKGVVVSGPYNIMSTDLNTFLNDFEGSINSARAKLREISEADARVGGEHGKWSPKQIVGHLIDSAANNHQRFVRAQFTSDLVFAGYEQEDWVKAQRYNDEPWLQLVDLWANYNLHLVHLISVIPTETLTQQRTNHNLDQIAWQTVSRSQPTTLEYFVRDYVGHMHNHLRQILGEKFSQES